MHWYQGSISEAISASRKSGSIFVVYIEGKDDKYKKFTDFINDSEISQQLESEHFVAIKIEETSISFDQFRQIYKQATAPSMFFIGKAGIPLEIITDFEHKNEFLNKLQTLVQKNGKGNLVTSSVSSSESLIKEEQRAEMSDKTNKTSTENNIPSTSKADVISNSTTPEEKDLSPEEKIERAQELISQARTAKRIEEEEKKRAQEIERRKMGQDVQKLKRWQQEQELKELMEERNKEKKEMQEARQRVLAQIAQDKAERAAKFSTISQSTHQTSSQPVHHNPVNSNFARLQFKLPDGTTHLQDFTSTSSLEIVRNYIIENLNLPFQNFTLSTTFPRREFTIEHNARTLVELELVPNAVILILPLQHGVITTNTNSWFTTIFWLLVTPILNFMSYLKSKIFGASTPTTSSNQGRKRVENKQESSTQKRKTGETTAIRRQGNVHRLTDNNDSDEDNNTWNGNSTQQM